MLRKSVFRRIKSSLGRYLAIFAIIALGVGFFAGLRVTADSMLKTADGYIDELALYDLRLVSTMGLTDEDVEAFAAQNGVKTAAGSVNADFMYRSSEGSNTVFRAHMITGGINGFDVISGRAPEAGDECVLDGKYYDESWIGKKLDLSPDNPEDTFDTFAYDSYTVVGIINSVYYINFERGGSKLGNGSVKGYVYIPAEGFSTDYYTEIFIKLDSCGSIYTDEYDSAVCEASERLEALLSDRADDRYNSIRDEAMQEIDEGRKKLDDALALIGGNEALLSMYEKEIKEAEEKLAAARAEVDAIEKPTVYVLDRTSNVGYACLENDTDIVTGVSRVFPLFFFLVAALVCTTTMTRMVDELRVENGVLKALGFGNTAIAGQYLFYSGSASLLGCITGFIIGSKFMPMALWTVYQIMYSVARPVAFLLDWKLFCLCTALYMLCSLGATWLVCRRMLSEQAAELLRPRAPAAGKRIFLEKIGFLWKHMPFLHKVSARNILRYKKRMIMMIAGIGGCTALLITGFGISDSIKPILDYQYTEIDTYDAAVTFINVPDSDARTCFGNVCSEVAESYTFMYTGTADITGDTTESVNLMIYTDPPTGFFNLHDSDGELLWPGTGEAAIDYRLARSQGLSVGDSFTLTDSDYRTIELRVCCIFENYIYDYVFISAETASAAWGESPGEKTAFVRFSEGTDAHEASAKLMSEVDGIASVSINADSRKTIGSMFQSLDYIVIIVLVCAGALAFIVLFNLTNISITERVREIATLKVLGFYRGETAAYVFRENIILTAISAVFGIPMGYALLNYVMAQIKIKSMYFPSRVSALSIVISVVLTFVFAVFAELFLTRKLESINMAESLKAIE